MSVLVLLPTLFLLSLLSLCIVVSFCSLKRFHRCLSFMPSLITSNTLFFRLIVVFHFFLDNNSGVITMVGGWYCRRSRRPSFSVLRRLPVVFF